MIKRELHFKKFLKKMYLRKAFNFPISEGILPVSLLLARNKISGDGGGQAHV